MPRPFPLSVNAIMENENQMLGLRGSAEVVGASIFDLGSWSVVVLGWTADLLSL